MRKKILCAMSLLAIVSAYAFAKDENTVYVADIPAKCEVLEFSGMNKLQLFNLANSWASISCYKIESPSANFNFIDYRNFETGLICGTMTYPSSDTDYRNWGWGIVQMYFSMEVMDGRIRFFAKPVSIATTTRGGVYEGSKWKKITTETSKFINFDAEFENFKNSLKKFIQENKW